jgi:hypothetical protein
MRRLRFGWPTIAISLGAVAFTLTTWALIGRALGRSTAPRRPPELHTRYEQHLSMPEAMPRPEAPPGPFTKFVMTFRRMKVHTEGNMAAVFGQVKVFDRVPGNQYIWLLRVYSYKNNKPKLLREHHYLENAVLLAEGQTQMVPVFNDFIGLDPGSYRLELTLYGVPPNFPFNRVKFGEDMRKRTLALVSHFARVVIS